MAFKWFKVKKYKWFTIEFVPNYPGILGSKHTREYKAMTLENAMRKAREDEKFCVSGMQVYRIARLIKVVE